MGLKLFDGDYGSDGDDISKISINKEFARRYEHNKKREDLQRLGELKKKGIVGDSDEESNESSDESLDDLLANPKKDLEFLNALIKVKNQDPVLKEKDAKLFESDDDDDDDDEETDEREKGKREKPMYLKDVVAKHLIEEGPEFEDGEERVGVKSYSQEQEELRKAFLVAAEVAMDEGDGGELLKVKESKDRADESDEDGGTMERKLDEYFGKDDNLDENEMFLKEYFKNKMWVDEKKGEKPMYEEGFDLSEDEDEIEKQEDYERGFNFRFEENAGDRVLGHSRVVEGSVRKKTNARKLQRKSKEERMAQAEFERKEELKHLKNLKRKEMNEKLRKIRETAGIGEEGICPLDEDDLEEEFDPDEHDRKMREAFDDEYYGADDADPEFGSDSDDDGGEFGKPDFDKEDELLGLPKNWDDISGSGDGFLAARERNLKRKMDSKVHEEEKEDEDDDDDEEEGQRKKKRKMSSIEKEVLEKELEEFYKLDYEDTIGDLKTRFKYRDVGAKRFGLSAKEILMMDDKDLNQYVSLKKIAPYREKEWKVPRVKTYNQKLKIKTLLQGEKPATQKTGKKYSRVDGSNKSSTAAKVEESNGDTSNLSKKNRRRRGQPELKLSLRRLITYGKIPSKSKSKKKH